MQPTASPQLSGPAAMPPMPSMAAADLQDNLMTASNDLDRLQTLLAHACDELMRSFHGATQQIHAHADGPDSDARVAQLFAGVMQHLTSAITALQFQDMASQLITHMNQRLRNCADRMAQESPGDATHGAPAAKAPAFRPTPVAQVEMDAGSVELF